MSITHVHARAGVKSFIITFGILVVLNNVAMQT
jgi:hypothetical protein